MSSLPTKYLANVSHSTVQYNVGEEGVGWRRW